MAVGCYVVASSGDLIVRVSCFFFFQAEDGIRDVAVTGVQTCALPIYGMMSLVKILPHDPVYALGANARQMPLVRVINPVTGATTASFLAFPKKYHGDRKSVV